MDDLIRRKQVIDMLDREYIFKPKDAKEMYQAARYRAEQLPAQNRKGRWIILGERKMIALDGGAERQYKELGYPHRNVLSMSCSECRMTTMVDASIAYKYCPHCGAEMEQDG